jgi:hypothetical protein
MKTEKSELFWTSVKVVLFFLAINLMLVYAAIKW